ncbi:flagellar hook-associated protein FlgK [Rhodobacterales bacterium 52_120_T64]|nr:flagellar hook-associated protein FlgK [Rhodobacterales bacterium 52_120_T64]
MSISSAMNNAYSGLSAMSRSAETVSNNVSNALTEGYSSQQVEYTATALGGQSGGVQIEGITRSEDVLATRLRRTAAADFSNTSTRSEALARLADAMGEPGDSGALAVRYAAVEDALSMAISAPDSVALQQSILLSAKSLTTTFNQISAEVNRVRTDADAGIAKDVDTVNTALKQVESLNAKIRMLSMSGRNASVLEDQRQIAVDRINEIIPIRQTKTDNGEIAIFSQGGEVLLNGSARTLEFTQTYFIVPGMTLASGALSGLSINGKPIDVGDAGQGVEGGSLSTNFLVRDSTAPEFQTQLDALAADLIERMQNPSVDLTLLVGDAGLFTDAGGFYSSINSIGISSRISVNASADPENGGELWRLRDGVGAITQGTVGESAQLIRFVNALDEDKPASANMGLSISMSGVGFAEEITSFWALESSKADEEVAYKQNVYSLLRSEELNAVGVDTDKEMQALLIIEQAYAANARVISVLDGLMQKLLEM